MDKFEKKDIGEIRKDIDNALKVVSKKHGITFKIGTIRFESANFRTKLECICNGSVKAGNGENLIIRKEWDDNCWKWNLKPEDFGKEFTVAFGSTYKVCGCRPKSGRYPILGKNIKTNKVYKFSSSSLRI